MKDNRLQGKILRWGNSLGIRLSREAAARLDLRPGDEVVVTVRSRPRKKVELPSWPSWALGGLAKRHDEADWQ